MNESEVFKWEELPSEELSFPAVTWYWSGIDIFSMMDFLDAVCGRVSWGWLCLTSMYVCASKVPKG